MKPYYDDGVVTIYHGDCRDILPGLEPGQAVVTDPPYGTDLAEWDKAEDFLENVATYIDLARRASTGAVAWFCAGKHLPAILKHLPDYHRLLDWDKKSGNGTEANHIWYSTEHIIIFGNYEVFRKYRGGSWTNSIISQAFEASKKHLCPKPEPVVDWLISHYSRPGGVVIDPFLGTGTTAASAKKLGRRCVGIEREERYCELSAERCRQARMFMPCEEPEDSPPPQLPLDDVL